MELFTPGQARRISLAIALCLTLVGTLLGYRGLSPLNHLEDRSLDLRFKLRGTLKPPASVVIAAIDEKSIAELGRWPWDRLLFARLVDQLTAAGAAVVAFDVMFTEPSPQDTELQQAMDKAGNVVLPLVFTFAGAPQTISDQIISSTAYPTVVNSNAFSRVAPITATGVRPPLPTLAATAMGFGHINMFSDNDGTLRWEALAIANGDSFYPALGVQTAALFLGIPWDKVTLDATRSVNIGPRRFPTDRFGRTLINYYGPENTFPYLSAADIIAGRVPHEQLAGKVVLIGASATGIYDLRVTPFSPDMPGVEKHASVIASIIDNRPLQQAPGWLTLLMILVSGTLLGLVASRASATASSACFGLLLLTMAGAALICFNGWGIWLNVSYPAMNLCLVFGATSAWHYAVTERRGRQVRAMFSSYITQSLVNELIAHPELAKLGGERREVSVLFSDIKDFTSFSEQHSPEEVVALLNEYLGAMTDIILKWEGTPDKFIGDAILAFWNAPRSCPDHAERAVRCALEMRERLTSMQQSWQERGLPLLDNGIGINTGEAVVGNIGAEGKKMEYTAIGDQINLGSRVESLTRRLDVPLLITETTLAHLQPAIDAGTLQGMFIEGLAKVIVKGRHLPVDLFCVTPLPEADMPTLVMPCPEMEPVKLTDK